MQRLIMMGLVVTAVMAIWVWWVFLGRKRLIQDVPTSQAKGVALGLNELVGTAVAHATAWSPQAGFECVWWSNVTYTEDSEGNWRKSSDRQGGPLAFSLTDESGSIPIRPRRARVSAPVVYEGPYQSDVFAGDPNPTLATRYMAGKLRSSRRKVVERVIQPGDSIYVLGTAQLSVDSLDVYVDEGTSGSDPFLIRVGSESDALFAERVGTVVGGAVALATAAGAGVAWADGAALARGDIAWAEIDPAPALGFAGLAALAMVMLSLVFVYNGLVRLRERSLAAWSLIDVQLRRRHDLIPDLVEMVKAHLAHEAAVQSSLVQLRASMAPELPPAPTDEHVRRADTAIRAETLAMDRLLALIEGYPLLTAEHSFATLRAELMDTEDRVALARSFYNCSVQALNDRAQVVLGSLVAWSFELELTTGFLDTQPTIEAMRETSWSEQAPKADRLSLPRIQLAKHSAKSPEPVSKSGLPGLGHQA